MGDDEMKIYTTQQIGSSINFNYELKQNMEVDQKQVLPSFVLKLKKNISSYANIYLWTYRLQGRILEVYQDYLIIRLNNKALHKILFSDINYVEIINPEPLA